MDVKHLHGNWACIQQYRRDRDAELLPVVGHLEQFSDMFALLEQVLATQDTTLDEYLLTLGPKPGYLK